MAGALYLDRLQSVMAQAMQGLPAGGERLRRGTIAYLDGCLHQRAVKALLLEARSEPAVAVEVQRRNAEGAALAQADFTVMNWPNPDVSARLFVAMVGEVVLSEVDAGQRDEAMRKTLWRFVRLA